VLIAAAVRPSRAVRFDALDLANRRGHRPRFTGSAPTSWDVTCRRAFFGARVSLAVGLVSAAVSVAIG
jgi:hypothetical protein